MISRVLRHKRDCGFRCAVFIHVRIASFDRIDTMQFRDHRVVWYALSSRRCVKLGIRGIVCILLCLALDAASGGISPFVSLVVGGSPCCKRTMLSFLCQSTFVYYGILIMRASFLLHLDYHFDTLQTTSAEVHSSCKDVLSTGRPLVQPLLHAYRQLIGYISGLQRGGRTTLPNLRQADAAGTR